eukprot:75557-Alexandrium_andersonii.AAC.1
MARRSEARQAAWVSASTDQGTGRSPLARSRICTAMGGWARAALSQQMRFRMGVRGAPAWALPNRTSTTTGV